MNFLKSMFGNYSKREVKRVQPICDKVLALEDNALQTAKPPTISCPTHLRHVEKQAGECWA